MSYLSHIEVDDTGLPVPSPELEQERRVAVFDLQEGNSFRVLGDATGPYRLRLGMVNGRAVFDWQDVDGRSGSFHAALGALSEAARDYRAVCEAYSEAVKTLPPARIEEVDAARRAMHGEAARQLMERLADHAEIDDNTARRLFTLICAMTDTS